MKKLITYLIYTYEYLKHGDFRSILAGLSYLGNKTSTSSDRLIRTSIGSFYCRRNTNDFQFANYRYEWGVKSFVLKILPEFDVFIDAGACIGDYTILIAKKGIKCISFEPLRNNYEAFLKNLSLNTFKGEVRTFNYGLGERNESQTFVYDPVNTGASHIRRNSSEEGSPVELRTLDSLVPDLEIKRTDRILIKLDVEGMEAQAVKGAANLITHHENLTLILEDKFSGPEAIKAYLNEYARFDYGRVDEYNFYARKTGNLN